MRSLIHMLGVVAARVEGAYGMGDKALAVSLRKAAEARATEIAEGIRADDETRRIERQRTLLAMCPDSSAVERLRAGLAQRAYDMMWDGDASACDAVIEFLPSALAEEVFAAWERDCFNREPRSRFFRGEG